MYLILNTANGNCLDNKEKRSWKLLETSVCVWLETSKIIKERKIKENK
jgi:hypothetical protein